MRDQELQSISIIDRQPHTIQPVRSDEGLTLGDILQRLLFHRWFIAACAVACVALSLLYLKLRPPVYEASAVLRIDPGRAETLAISDRPATVPTEPGETLHTEIVLLKSDDVAIRTLNSLSDDEFAKFIGVRRGPNLIPLDVQHLSDQQQGWMTKLEKAITVKQIDGTQTHQPHRQVARSQCGSGDWQHGGSGLYVADVRESRPLRSAIAYLALEPDG